MRKIYITWQGSGLCGWGGGDFRITLEEAEKEVKKWCIQDGMTYDSSTKSSVEFNECGGPWHYIEEYDIPETVYWGIQCLSVRIARLEEKLDNLHSDIR